VVPILRQRARAVTVSFRPRVCVNPSRRHPGPSAARGLQYRLAVFTVDCWACDGGSDTVQGLPLTLIRTAGGRMTGKSRRGFASMDPARQREIASKGGRAAHEKGTAHEWSSDEAREAGRKGGVTVSRDRAHMAAIGREGGESRSAAARQARLARMSEREVPMQVARESNQARPATDRPRTDAPRSDESSAR
jgi:uncharacterized protein